VESTAVPVETAGAEVVAAVGTVVELSSVVVAVDVLGTAPFEVRVVFAARVHARRGIAPRPPATSRRRRV